MLIKYSLTSMKSKFFILILCLCCSGKFATQLTAQHKKLAPYIETINQAQQSPVDYIMSLFEEHDIVVLCERSHPEFMQYEFINDLIADERFQKKVGNVFTELADSLTYDEGAKALQRKADSLTISADLIAIQRNHFFHPLWPNYNFYTFLYNINQVNRQLPEGNKIQWYPCDIPIHWDSIQSSEQYERFYASMADDRDQIMANYFIARYNRIKKNDAGAKALVIMNYRHAYMNSYWLKNRWKTPNFGRYIKEYYHDLAVNVLINTTTETKHDEIQLIHKGKWDAAFEHCGNKAVGFNLKDTPFGDDKFDGFPWVPTNLIYSDVFHGFVFTHPVEDFRYIYNYKGLVDSVFYKEYVRRSEMTVINREDDNKSLGLDSLKELQTLLVAQEDSINALIEQKKRWLK
jgi:hypothetical protein